MADPTQHTPVDYSAMDDEAAEAEVGICFADCEDFLDKLDPATSASRALKQNPRNASMNIPIGPDAAMSVEASPANLAFWTAKSWGSGYNLRVAWLSGTTWQKNKVKRYAPLWANHGNFRFTFDADVNDCDILIDFHPRKGSWSYVGTDCSYYAERKEPSMNLGWVVTNKTEEQIRQVILHEFGHALGAIHEHQSPISTIKWDKPVVYRKLMGKPNYWDETTVYNNMFKPFPDGAIQTTDSFDGFSIMLYYYPDSWTTDGRGTRWNSVLSAGDKAYIGFCYPSAALDVGQFNTQQVRPWTEPQLSTASTLSYFKTYEQPPRVALGLTQLDVDKSRNVRVKAFVDDVTEKNFRANVNAWDDTILYIGGVSYLELGPGFESVQTGTFDTQEVSKPEARSPQVSKRIEFSWPFNEMPEVIVWLNTVDLDNSKNLRIKSYVTDVDKDGFTAHIDTWDDSIMYAAGLTWLAYPKTQPGVASGFFSTDQVRPVDQPRADNTSSAVFNPADGSFSKTPKVMLALSGFDYDCRANLRVRVSTSSVTDTAVTWHLQSWADSTMYSASGSYFAWA